MNPSKPPRRSSLSSPQSRSNPHVSHPHPINTHSGSSSPGGPLLPPRSYSLSRRGSFVHTSSFVSELSPTDPSFHRFFSRKLSVTPSDVRVLVVDADPIHARVVASQLTNAGYPVDVVPAIDTALMKLKSPPPLSLISGIFSSSAHPFPFPSLTNQQHDLQPSSSSASSSNNSSPPVFPPQVPVGPDYSLVICDIASVNGLQLLRSIRSDLHLLLVPVIMMASVEEMELANGSLRAGADDYLIKPVKLEAVKGVWRSVWRKRKEKKVLQLLEEERKKRKSLEVKLESLEHQVSSAIETPIQLITQAISTLLSSEQGMSDSAKTSLRQILDGLRSSNLYRPAFERVLSRHDVDAETKSWLASEVLRDQTIVTAPNTTPNSTCSTPAASPSLSRMRRISESQRRKLAEHRSASTNMFPIPFAVEESMDSDPVASAELPVLIPHPSHLLLLSSWNFDVWSYTHAELLVFLIDMFADLGLLQEFEIDRALFFAFLKDVEQGYNQNPYHNFRHAFDVTQAAYLFLRSGCPEDESWNSAASPATVINGQRIQPGPPTASSIQRALVAVADSSDSCESPPSPLPPDANEEPQNVRSLTIMFPRIEQFAFMLACCLHDIGHDGKSNNFHIQTQSPLSILYNDQSPQENKHIHQGYSLITRHALLAHLPRPVQSEIRTLMIRCILSTDLGNHVEVLARFNEISPKFNQTEKEHRARTLEMLIKCADVSNVVRPLHLAKGWADCIQEEMFEQGDLEREMGIMISGFSDRMNPQSARLGLGFSEFLCAPLFRTIGQSLPAMTNYATHIAVTQEYWASILALTQDDEHECGIGDEEEDEEGEDRLSVIEEHASFKQQTIGPGFGRALSDIPSEPEMSLGYSPPRRCSTKSSLSITSVCSSVPSNRVSPTVRISPPLLWGPAEHVPAAPDAVDFSIVGKPSDPIPPPTTTAIYKGGSPTPN